MLKSVLNGFQKRPLLCKTIRACSWESMGTVCHQGASLLTGLLTARLLGQDRLGEWAIVLTLLVFFLNIGSMNIARICTRFVAEYGHNNPRRAGQIVGFVLLTVFLLGVAVVAVCFVAHQWIATYFFDCPAIGPLIPCVGIAVFLTLTLTCFRSILYGGQQYRLVAMSNLVFALSRLAGFCGLFAVPDLQYLAWAYVLACLVAAVHAGVLAWRTLQRMGIPVSFDNYFRERTLFLDFCLPGIILTALEAPINTYTRILVIMSAGGMNAMAGVYVASNWQQLVVFIPYQLCRVVSPLFADLRGRGLHKELVRYALQVAISAFAIGVGSAIVLAAIGRYLLGLYGEGFLEFYPLFLLMLFAGAVEACSSSLVGLYAVLDAMWWRSVSAIGGQIIALACALLLIPRLGVMGFGWAILAQHLAGVAAIAVMLRRKAPRVLNTETPRPHFVGTTGCSKASEKTDHVVTVERNA
jgi:O-antigen/teichoic acid export membrane protein